MRKGFNVINTLNYRISHDDIPDYYDFNHLDNILSIKPIKYIIALGSINSTLGGSEYLKTIYGKIEGPIHNFDIESELSVQKLCLNYV